MFVEARGIYHQYDLFEAKRKRAFEVITGLVVKNRYAKWKRRGVLSQESAKDQGVCCEDLQRF